MFQEKRLGVSSPCSASFYSLNFFFCQSVFFNDIIYLRILSTQVVKILRSFVFLNLVCAKVYLLFTTPPPAPQKKFLSKMLTLRIEKTRKQFILPINRLYFYAVLPLDYILGYYFIYL